MKNIFRKLQQDSQHLLAHDETINSEKGGSDEAEFKRRQTIAAEGGVGDLDDTGGQFGLGRSLRDAKPVTKIELSKEKEAEIAAMENWEPYVETQDDLIHQEEEAAILSKMRNKKRANTEKRAPIDRQTAFIEFKATDESKEIEAQIIESRKVLREKREELRGQTASLNSIKAEIDNIKTALDQKNEQKRQNEITQAMSPGFNSQTDGFDFGESPEQMGNIIDEEELNLIRELKDLKKKYRDAYKVLKDSKSESSFTQQAIDSFKQKLISAFEEWYNDTFEEATPEGAAAKAHTHSTPSLVMGTQKSSAMANKSSPSKLVRDPEMDEDQEDFQPEGREGIDVDPDAAAYIRAKKAVKRMEQARKNQD